MKRKYKIILIIIVLALTILLFVWLFNSIFSSSIKEIVVLDEIKDYGYSLEDRDTKLFEDTYNNLKSNLESNSIDYEEYAKDLSKLYVTDLYTINNKISKYDVGGSEYILDSAKENYSLKVSETMYKYIGLEDKLPEVVSVSINNINESEYTVEDKTYDSYIVDISWTYEEDLGYDKSMYLTLIKDDTKLSIVEMTSEAIDEETN